MIINPNAVLDRAVPMRFHNQILIISLILVVIDGYDLMIYGSTVALIMTEFQISAAVGGLIGSAGMAGAAIGALIIGNIADRIGRKSSIIACSSVFSTAMMLTGLFAHGPLFFLIMRFLAGCALGGLLPNVISLSSEYMPAGKRETSVAMIMSGMALGGALGGFTGMMLFPRFGWRAAYIVGGAFLILLLPVVVRILPESPNILIKRGKENKLALILEKIEPGVSTKNTFTCDESKKNPGRAPVSEVLKGRRKYLSFSLWAVYFLSFFVLYGIGTWLPSLVMSQGYSHQDGLMMVMFLNMGAFVVAILLGNIKKQFDITRLICICFFLCFTGVFMMAFSSNLMIMSLFTIMAGIGNNIGQNYTHGIPATLFPPEVRSTAMGMCLGIGRIGSILGPYIGGLMISLGVPTRINYIVIAVPALLAVLVVISIRIRFYNKREH